MIRTLSAAALCSVLLAGAAQAQPAPPPIAAAVADAGRPDADKARDANRKPAEVVAFAGVRPGMVVAELVPGSGYYTRILSKAVGPNGKVYAIVPAAMASRPGAMDGLNALIKAYPNVEAVATDPAAMTLPQKIDLYWTTENYHDMHNNGMDIAKFNKSVFDALKPGGTFLVEDHAAKPGTGPSATTALHRIEVAQAKAELQAAGFRLDGESNALRNPADPGDTTNRDAGIQGRTDRFILRAKRP